MTLDRLIDLIAELAARKILNPTDKPPEGVWPHWPAFPDRSKTQCPAF